MTTDGAGAGAVARTRRTRHRHVIRWVAGGVLVVLCVVGVALATRTPQEATQVDSPLLGHMAPAVAGTDLRTGAPVSLAALRGRYVFVNFFASWCLPCQQEAPDLVAFDYDQQHTPGGADLIGVVFHDELSSARAFQRSQGATWSTVGDPGGTIAEHYGVTGPPTTFLVDPSGRITVDPSTGPATQAELAGMLKEAALAGSRGRRLPLAVRVALPLLVLAIALLVGGGAFSGSPPTVSQKAAAIEADVRCPSCTDVSVAQSEESTALAVRHEIVRMVTRGQSAGQIDRTLVAQYGPTILLVPPASDGVALIWILPTVLGVGALAVVGVAFVRRARQFADLRRGAVTAEVVTEGVAGDRDG